MSEPIASYFTHPMTPAQRAKWLREKFEKRRAEERRQKVERGLERARSTPVAPTVENLIAALNRATIESEDPEVARRYAVHLVQPYCRCRYAGDMGWLLCGHVIDEGLGL